MITIPSRNGMLLRNSNGIISSDCGGPVAFTCPCELLTGTNCSCYGTGLTPSSYELDWGNGVKYCLEYVSGDIWRKTIGTTVITLDLSYDGDAAKITVVEDSVTVFSGTLTGTSCVHRLSGTMTNTISPSDWGSVTYDTPCNDTAFTCPCTLLPGDKSQCFGTDLTPETYIAIIDGISYCLTYDTGDDLWRATVGELTIELNLVYSSDSAELKVIENEETVFTAYKTGTSCVHRWSGSDLENIIENDWLIGSYYTECVQPDFECDCMTMANVVCDSFGRDNTPPNYIVDFGGGAKYCLEWDSGCEWNLTVGELTITLNLNATAKSATLTVMENSEEVFSGSKTESVLSLSTYGQILNTYNNDWGVKTDESPNYGYAVFTPACSSNSCINGRMIMVECDFGFTELRGRSNYQVYISYPPKQAFGYLSYSSCYMYISVICSVRIYSPNCSSYSDITSSEYGFSVSYNAITKVWNVVFTDSNFFGSITQDVDLLNPGDTITIPVVVDTQTPAYSTCSSYDLATNAPYTSTFAFNVRVTVY